MQAIDTNVVVRLLVRDDEDQGRRAEAVFRRALATGGVWIPVVVLVETYWVLRSAYRFDRTSVVKALRALVSMEGVSIERAPEVAAALDGFDAGRADFADAVILESARTAGALPLWTFDERFAQTEGVERVP